MIGVHMRYHNIVEATQQNVVLKELDISAFRTVVNEVVLREYSTRMPHVPPFAVGFPDMHPSTVTFGINGNMDSKLKSV